MTAIASGAVFGLLCAVFVAFLGFRYIKRHDRFDFLVRGAARVALIVASAVLALFGCLTAYYSGGGFAFFTGWALGYASGLGAYFVIRYRFMSS